VLVRRIALLAAAVSMLLFALAPAAQAAVYKEFGTFSWLATSICGHEEVQIDGTTRLIASDHVDANDGTHSAYTLVFQAAHGVGLQSGHRYIMNEADHININFRSDGSGPVQTSGTITGRFIETGEDRTYLDDTYVQIFWHATQNANGEVTVTFDRQNIVCK
jgi:hypothetical protein